MKAKQHGFTLIELMITVAIVGILAAVAYPSYTEHLRKGARAQAKAQMLDIANREQQFLLANRSYADKTALQNSGYNLPPDLASRYDWDVAVATNPAPTFTVTFTAKGSQLNDGDLGLNSSGVKTGKW